MCSPVYNAEPEITICCKCVCVCICRDIVPHRVQNTNAIIFFFLKAVKFMHFTISVVAVFTAIFSRQEHTFCMRRNSLSQVEKKARKKCHKILSTDLFMTLLFLCFFRALIQITEKDGTI